MAPEIWSWNHVYQPHTVEPKSDECQFTMRRGTERLACRALYHDSYGVETQLLVDDTPLIERRFPMKELAIASISVVKGPRGESADDSSTARPRGKRPDETPRRSDTRRRRATGARLIRYVMAT